jgi:uncharacterized protein YbjT (DUF2867 family)
MKSPFVIFSAGSAQAFAVAQTAIDQGVAVRAVSRSGKQSLLKGEFETSHADLGDVESIVAAMKGARAAFFHLPIPSAQGESESHLNNFLLAAKQAALPMLIFSSSSFADDSFSSTPLIDANRQSVKQVLASDIPSIVLKPGLYLENLLVPLFVPNLARSILDYPPMRSDQPMSWTSHWDQAILAVASIDRLELAGNAYNIASLEAVTPSELATLIGKKRNDSLMSFQAINPDQFAQRVSAALGNPNLSFLLADLYRSINQQKSTELIVDTDQLQRIFGVTLKSVSERIAEW